MRCAICNADSDAVTEVNSDCPECQEVIYETLAGYGQDDITGNTEPELISLEDANIEC